MKRIVLHIGSGKTGSTSVQRALYESKSANDNTIFYPILLNHKGNQIFRFAFCDVNDTPSNIKRKFLNDPEGYLEYQESIKKSFEQSIDGYDDVIISSEFLFISDREEVVRIKEYLVGLGFEQIFIFMYLRDPAKYYLSVAQQALKNQAKLPKPESFRYNMIGAVRNWEEIAGSNLFVQEFERELLYNNDVVDDFSEFLFKIGYSAKLVLSSNVNESMSVESAMLLQEFHRLLELSEMSEDSFLNNKLRARRFSNKSYGGTKPKLKKNISDYVYFLYRDELTELYNRFGVFSGIKELSDEMSEHDFAVPSPCYFTDIVNGFDFDKYNELWNEI
jgi:hypothetical protein